jgi:hypothetical protein
LRTDAFGLTADFLVKVDFFFMECPILLINLFLNVDFIMPIGVVGMDFERFSL